MVAEGRGGGGRKNGIARIPSDKEKGGGGIRIGSKGSTGRRGREVMEREVAWEAFLGRGGRKGVTGRVGERGRRIDKGTIRGILTPGLCPSVTPSCHQLIPQFVIVIRQIKLV